MNLRPFIRIIILSAAILMLLLIVSELRDRSQRATRERVSTYVPLVQREGVKIEDINGIEVTIPLSGMQLRYRRVDGLWRLPDFANAYALSADVDVIVKQLLASAGRPVAVKSKDQSQYGLAPSVAPVLSLFQGTSRVLRLEIGVLAPGRLKDERYIARDDDETIYLLNSNPETLLTQSEDPPMLDRHILPRSLPHGIPSKVSFSGTRASSVKEYSIVTRPIDPSLEREDIGAMKKKKEPTHEFRAAFPSGEKLLDEQEGMNYTRKMLDVEFDKIVGGISPAQREYRNFDTPLLEITMLYDTNSSSSLAVSSSLIEGKYPILNRNTGQLFIISSEKFEQLIPNFEVKK